MSRSVWSAIRVGFAAAVLAECATAPVRSRDSATALDYRSVRAAAQQEVLRGDSLLVEHVRLGALDISDTLRLTIANLADAPRLIGVSVRLEAGLWSLRRWQAVYPVALAARERRTVALPYDLPRGLTTEGSLRLRVGTIDSATPPITIRDPVIDRRFLVGVGNPAAVDPRAHFDSLHTEHLDLYAYPGSPGARDLSTIAEVRERALTRVAGLLGVSFDGRVRVVLYPDSATKTTETGHIGMGWANNGTIVEIYNDQDRLDPYHELVHIVAGAVGDPPAMLDEGFAVYATELLGADALAHLGHPGRTLHQATCDLARTGRRVSLDSLLTFSEFGSREAPGDILYPQGGSAVKYLIDTYGVERFREAYRTFQRGDPDVGAAFARVFGAPPSVVDAAWRSAVDAQCAR